MRFFSSKTYDNLYEYLIASYKGKKYIWGMSWVISSHFLRVRLNTMWIFKRQVNNLGFFLLKINNVIKHI